MTERDDPCAFDAPQSAHRLMRVNSTPIGSAVVVEVAGELDLHTAPHLMASIDKAFTRPGLSLVVINLSKVELLGSSGLGVLANLATLAAGPDRPAVVLRVVAPAQHYPVARPWEAMNLQQILPLYPDITAALAVN